MPKIRQKGDVPLEKFLEKEHLFLEILETIDEGIHAVDENGYTIFYNHVAAKHDGLARDEVLGKHLLEVFPSLTEETSTLLKVIRTKKPIYHMPQQYVNLKGEKIETVNTTLPIIIGHHLIGAVEVAKDYSKLKSLSEKLIDLQKKAQSNVPVASLCETTYTFDDIITYNQDLKNMKKFASRIAQSSSSVLIYGETGSGKELFVQSIHNDSPRKNGPFIAQNCAALPESLLESILFGTSKGSYTGAVDRAGLFELAHQGTLFLDELQSMPLSLQAKLLRVLEDGYVRRIGSSESKKVDVRIIVAMNEEPMKCVRDHRLREDLFYRLNVFSLAIPPLRERKEDIIPLAHYFINVFNQQLNLKVNEISQEVQHLLLNHNWPGNVRELKHVMEYALNVVDGEEITVHCLPEYVRFKHHRRIPQKNKSLREELAELEKKRMEEALLLHNGNVLKAASYLKMPRQTLQYKIKRYQINRQNFGTKKSNSDEF